MKIRKVFMLLLAFTLISVGTVFAVNTPENVITTATINVSKVLTPSNGVYPDVDLFSFELKPVSYTLASTGNIVNDVAANYMPAGDIIDVNVVENVEEKQMEGTTVKTLDFTGLEPGIYTYTLQEIVPQVPVTGVEYDSTIYYVNIYVVYQVDENNVPTENTTISRITTWKNYNMSDDALKGQAVDGVANPDAESGKVDISTDENPAEISYPFKNTYETSAEIHLSKMIEGNYANKNQLFRFEIDLEDGLATAGDYELVYLDQEGNEIAEKSEIITSGVKQIVSLKHGEKIVIKELPASASYTVTEVQEKTYSGRYTIDGGIVSDIKTGEASTGINLVASGRLADNNMKNGVLSNEEISFINTKNYIVPTGVILSVAPFVLAIILIGAIFMVVRSKKFRGEK